MKYPEEKEILRGIPGINECCSPTTTRGKDGRIASLREVTMAISLRICKEVKFKAFPKRKAHRRFGLIVEDSYKG